MGKNSKFFQISKKKPERSNYCTPRLRQAEAQRNSVQLAQLNSASMQSVQVAPPGGRVRFWFESWVVPLEMFNCSSGTLVKYISCQLSIMAKGPFGLRRLSDALNMITPKKLKTRFRKEDEDDCMTLSEVTKSKVSTAVREEESSFVSHVSCPTVRDCEGPLREEESLSKKEPAKVC